LIKQRREFKMCKYCENVKTGDNYEPLLSKDVNLGFAGKFFSNVYMGKNSKNKPSLEMEIGMYNLDTYRSEEITINYCPICGCKLADIVASK
jgi:hypothetical protein